MTAEASPWIFFGLNALWAGWNCYAAHANSKQAKENRRHGLVLADLLTRAAAIPPSTPKQGEGE